MTKEPIDPTDATDPKHVRELAKELAKWRRDVGLDPLIMVGLLVDDDDLGGDVLALHDQDPDADLSGELLELGLAHASDPGGKLPRRVIGYLDTLPEASAATTGLQLHDAGVVRCIAAEWTVRAVVVGDEVLPGRVSLVPRTEWARTGTPALWRWTISLPWWLLATPGERARGLAHMAAQCGWTGDREAHIRRPDFSGFASVIRKHGLPDTKANARALALVSGSQVLVDMLHRHYPKGLDGKAVSQGLLFGAAEVAGE